MLKNVLKSKTIIVAVIAGLISLLGTKEIAELFGQGAVDAFPQVIAILMIIMRFLTGSSLKDKQSLLGK